VSEEAPRDNLLVLLADDPVPGRVQSGLAAVLGESRAAALHLAFVADAVRAAQAATSCDALVALAPGSTGAWLDRLGDPAPRWHQRPGDEGARRRAALSEARALGYRAAALLVPTPAVSAAALDAAFAALARHTAVVAPDGAGGYALLGYRGEPPAELFDGMPWGRADLLQRTETRLWALDVDVATLPELPAVRTHRDLDRLRARLLGVSPEQRPRATAEALGIPTELQ
jgi:hypothetical protein